MRCLEKPFLEGCLEALMGLYGGYDLILNMLLEKTLWDFL